MLPLPTADNILSSTSPTSNTVLGAFLPYGYAEIGVMLAALLIVFLIYWFWDAISALLHHTHKLTKFDDTKNSKF